MINNPISLIQINKFLKQKIKVLGDKFDNPKGKPCDKRFVEVF